MDPVFQLDQHWKVGRVTARDLAADPVTYSFTEQWYDAGDWETVVGGVFGDKDDSPGIAVGGALLAVGDLVQFRAAASPDPDLGNILYELLPLALCCAGDPPEPPTVTPLPCPDGSGSGGEPRVDCTKALCYCPTLGAYNLCQYVPPWLLLGASGLTPGEQAWLVALTGGETLEEAMERCPDLRVDLLPPGSPACGGIRALYDAPGTGLPLRTCFLLFDGTGAAGDALASPVSVTSTAAFDPTFGTVWPVAYQSADGNFYVSGSVVLCADADGNTTPRFVGAVYARTAAGSGSGSGSGGDCGCVAEFFGCPAAGDPETPSQSVLVAWDGAAGAATLLIDFGCGTFDLTVGPCPPESPCCDLPGCVELVIPDGPAAGTYELTAVGPHYQTAAVPGFTYVQFDKVALGGGECRYVLTNGTGSGTSSQWATAAACDPFGVAFEGSPLGAAGTVIVRECTGLGDCMACDLVGAFPTLVVPDGPNAGTYAMTAWGVDGGGNPVATVDDFAYGPTLPFQLICSSESGLPGWGFPGTAATGLACGPPAVFAFEGTAWGSTGDVVVTT